MYKSSDNTYGKCNFQLYHKKCDFGEILGSLKIRMKNDIPIFSMKYLYLRPYTYMQKY